LENILGVMGMPRRVYTYLETLGWQDMNMLATVGAFTIGAGVLVYVINFAVSVRRGAPAGNDPWGSFSLEWSTSSPPPPYNYLHMPTVHDGYPMWSWTPDQPVVSGLSAEKREVLVTRVMDAEPDHREETPRPSMAPFLVAVADAIGITVAIFTPWGVPAGFVLAALALVAWFWPQPPHKELLEEQPS